MAFALVALCSSSVPVGIHCAWSLSTFVPSAAKNVVEMIFTVSLDSVKEQPIVECLSK